MKKITSFLTIALIAIISLTFTACDDDSNVAYTLDGTWRGKMYIQNDGHNSTYSVIRFDNNDGLYSGSGYWIDYYGDNYWSDRNYIANHITWTVHNGNIYIKLIEENREVVIYNYRLSSGYFTGDVETNNNKHASFNLTKDNNYYNWQDDFYYGKVSYTLDGTWRGKMYVQYGGYNSTYSVIRFDNNDGLYSGTGYWIDYYDGNYWGSRNYIANRITWTVRDGNIYINLIDEGSKVVIYDYRLSSGYFTGYVDASNGNRASFRLTKDDTFNWRDDFYYNKVPTSIGSISRSADTDSIQPMRKFVVK